MKRFTAPKKKVVSTDPPSTLEHYMNVRVPDDIWNALQKKVDIIKEDFSTVVRMTLREQLKSEKLL